MSRIYELRQLHNQELEKFCRRNQVNFASLQRLLEAERAKKFMKRSAFVQPIIDQEINNNLENEN